jgi:hypothetical protein
MSGYLVLMALLLTAAPSDKKADFEKRNTVEMTCGKLILVEPVLFNGASVNGQLERTPIKNTKLRLYYREARTRCCKKQSLAAETVTRKDGTFDFTSVAPGFYWLVGRRDGAHYVVPINFAPNAQTGDKCSELIYELRSAERKLVRVLPPYVIS